MLNDKPVIALVPARGGSKRLPGKNVKLLAGKPLIAWTIEAARHSLLVDKVVLSTDDEEIAQIGRVFGAEVPFIRPIELSSDTATTASVVLHAIDRLALPATCVLLILQPTSPLRTSSDIDQALFLLEERGAEGVVSVCECEHNPLWSGTLSADWNMEGFLRDDLLSLPRSKIPRYYRLNGAIY